MELVHDHVVDTGLRTFTQSLVGKNFGGATDDERAGIHRGIPSDHPDIVRTKSVTEGEELLIGKSLDGNGVIGPSLLADRAKMESQSHQRFPRPGRGVQDDIPTLKQLQNGLLLMIVRLDPGVHEPFQKAIQNGLV